MIDKKKQEAIDKLKQLIDKKIVYMVQYHVSSSGMTRYIKIYNHDMQNITSYVDDFLQWGQDKKQWGLKVWGCGMDMHFHTAYCLSYIYDEEERKELTGNGGGCLEWKSL